jgi:hypothetical protein
MGQLLEKVRGHLPRKPARQNRFTVSFAAARLPPRWLAECNERANSQQPREALPQLEIAKEFTATSRGSREVAAKSGSKQAPRRLSF